LDYIAAGVFLLKGDWSNACAVIKARQEFLRMRSQFVSDRKQNLRLTVVRYPLGRFPFSILWEAKLKGKKLYSLLPIDTAAVVGK
jgi:hypothetical protein